MIYDIHNSGSQPDSQLKGLIKSRLLLILSHANSLVAADSDGWMEPPVLDWNMKNICSHCFYKGFTICEKKTQL